LKTFLSYILHYTAYLEIFGNGGYLIIESHLADKRFDVEEVHQILSKKGRAILVTVHEGP
jgi:hypothetical protein